MPDVYLNGRYLPLEEARVSVLDRGFTFGDSVYEVFLVYNRKIFLFDEHMQRLNNSLAAIYMENPLSIEEWHEILYRLVDSNPATHQSLYLQVTRGVSERDHAIALADKPTVFAMSKPLPERDLTGGIPVITSEDIRWKLCYIKATTLLPSVLLRHQALLAGAREAILVKNDYVTEGAASNLFIVKDQVIRTPPKDGNLLPGITRDLVIDLLNRNSIPFRETTIHRDELTSADELWITSSTMEIVPVILLDGKPVGTGKPGAMWEKVFKLYNEFKNSI